MKQFFFTYFLINHFLNFFWIQSLICPYFYLETSSYFLLLLLGFMCQVKTHNLELIILTCQAWTKFSYNDLVDPSITF